MVGVANLVVLACAWAAAVAVPALREACKPVQAGQFPGEPIRLKETILQAGIADWRVLIPDIPSCPHGLVGVYALVCDYDLIADAHFESMNVIVVHRNGALRYPASVTPTVFCGNPQYQNNQPLLQNNQLYLSDNLPWQTNQNVAHLYGQSPLALSTSLPSLGLASQSSLGQSFLPSLTVTPLSHGQSSLGLPLSLLDLSQNPLLGLSQQSALPSLSHSPLPLLDQSHNLLFGQSPLQLLNLGQSPPLLSSQSSLPLLGHSSLPLLQLGHLPQLHSSQSTLPLSAQSPLLLGQSSPQLLGQSPLLLGQSTLLGNSPPNLIASL